MPQAGGAQDREAYIRGAKEFLANKREALREKNREIRDKASEDARAIIDMIVRDYKPLRIYQWGSLLTKDGFRDYSDIDIAVEGITSISVLSELEGKAYRLTEFPLDLVALEKVHPRHAESIRRKGRLVYERP